MRSTTLEALGTRLQERRALPPPVLRRELRRVAGARLADVADYCGVTKQAVSMWELGQRTPTDKNLRRYLEVLRVFRGEGAA